jgi:membrane protease YdiL (CAAX protease family)
VAVSWAIIAIACLGTVAGNLVLSGRAEAEQDDTTRLILLRLQARVLVAASRVTPGRAVDEAAAFEAEATTPRLARAVAALYTEIDPQSPSPRALALLDRHRAALDEPDEQALHDAVATAVRDGSNALTAEQRDRIRSSMGWFGELLLAADLPDDDPARRALLASARRTLLGFAVVLVAGGAGVLGGAVLLIVAVVLRRDGRLRLALDPPRTHGSVYVRAFAVYVGLFFLLQMVPALAGGVLGGSLSGALAFVGLVVASVLGVLWPVLQGVPVADARRDLGVHAGRGFLREVACGVVGYVAILPVFAAGFATTLLLLSIRSMFDGGDGGGPVSHPIVPLVAEGGLGVRLMVLFLAAGFAPFFEEWMFRGALYGHLRARLGIGASGVLMALLFAAIHPQGLLTVPALGSLAFGFGLLREWRGSLIAPMVAHAVHNGTLVALMWIALG